MRDKLKEGRGLLGALFNPGGRIDRLQFWSGFLLLMIVGGFLALGQERAPASFLMFFVAALVTKFNFYCVFAQRFRDRRLAPNLAFIPIGVGAVAAVVAWFAVTGASYMPLLFEVANDRGHEARTIVELETALRADPGIERAAQLRAQDQSFVFGVVRESAGPCFLAFWAVAGVAALWAGGRARAARV